MMTTFHEGKVCDAVLRYLEEREGGTRQYLYSPETIGHPVPIDLTCRLNGRTLAIEHTGIEPFSNQIEMSVHSKAFFDPVRDDLSGILPRTETYELLVPADATRGLKRHEIPLIQKALVNWIMGVAPTLPISPLGHYQGNQNKVRPPGVPFTASLYRFDHVIGSAGRLVVIGIVSGEDLPRERRDRLEKACTKKFPNLVRWKRDYGANRTILLLEDVDFQLTNAVLVAHAIRDITTGSTDVPNAIYYVFTATTDVWWVSPILVDGKSVLDDTKLVYDWSIDPSTLLSLTGR
jgi:hypothetical protein